MKRDTHIHTYTKTKPTIYIPPPPRKTQKLPNGVCASTTKAVRVLLRLAHQFASGEDAAALSQPATVNLRR